MGGGIAILWDESYLWGLWMHEALNAIGAKPQVITAASVRTGALKRYAALAVPGGWASNKIKALGDEGACAIRDFVKGGGGYFGVCGGAGLATSDGLGLARISRKPTRERVPSLSGPVRLTLLNPHPAWEGIEGDVFHIWWPSQFVPQDDSIKVLASFHSATDEAYSSDIPVKGVPSGGWGAREDEYGLNLDPARMNGDPITIETTYGKGRVVLSLAHFDTPGDRHGLTALANVCRTLGVDTPRQQKTAPAPEAPGAIPENRIYTAANRVYEFGIEAGLWFKRGPITQWKRGVRGLEYFTLMSMARQTGPMDEGSGSGALARRTEEFGAGALELLELEQQAIRSGQGISFKESTGPRMEELRRELFSLKKSHGGMFRAIIRELDALLLKSLLK